MLCWLVGPYLNLAVAHPYPIIAIIRQKGKQARARTPTSYNVLENYSTMKNLLLLLQLTTCYVRVLVPVPHIVVRSTVLNYSPQAIFFRELSMHTTVPVYAYCEK